MTRSDGSNDVPHRRDRRDRQPATRVSLIARARAGDVDEFVAVYRPVCYRVARRFGLQHADADDVSAKAIDCLLRWIRLNDYDPKRSFLALVDLIAERRGIDHMRAATPEISLEEDAHQPTVDFEDRLERLWQEEIIRLALDRARTLSSAQTYDVFQRVRFDGLEYAQAAAEFGMTEEAARKAVSRVRNRVRAAMRWLSEE